MNITQAIADANLESWKNLGHRERDKIIYDALFSGELGESTPMFSHNIQQAAATDALTSKLTEIGVADVKIECLPRSTRSIVSCGDMTLPMMPAHKGVAYIGYLCAVGKNES
jgi:hypothetical protein